MCTVALPSTPIAFNSWRTRNCSCFFLSGYSGRRSAKDTMVDSRSLPITLLLATVWFCSLTLAAQRRLDRTNDGGKLQVDIHSLQQLAHQGDGNAAYLLGRAYMMGTGVAHDYRESASGFCKPPRRGRPMPSSPWATYTNRVKGSRGIIHRLCSITAPPQ